MYRWWTKIIIVSGREERLRNMEEKMEKEVGNITERTEN